MKRRLFLTLKIIFIIAIGFGLGVFSTEHFYNNYEKRGFNPVNIDSLLQVTPEQKAALDSNRIKCDSALKKLRENKHAAERKLGEALDANDSLGVEKASLLVIECDKALLEHRIGAMRDLSKILTKEQLEKFNNLHKMHNKKPKFKEFQPKH